METKRSKTLLFFLIAFQAILLALMFAWAFHPLYFGKEIRFKMRPIDPRDFFRGNYVILNYPFNSIDINRTGAKTEYQTGLPNDLSEKKYEFGDTLYLELEPEGDFYSAAGLWVHPPKGKTFLRVIVSYDNDTRISLKTPIDSYYTDPETAKEMEKMTSWRNRNKVETIVTIKVTDQGIARIKDVSYKFLPEN